MGRIFTELKIDVHDVHIVCGNNPGFTSLLLKMYTSYCISFCGGIPNGASWGFMKTTHLTVSRGGSCDSGTVCAIVVGVFRQNLFMYNLCMVVSVK